MYKPYYPVDLHCHTKRSDGNDTPKELIDEAVKIGMKVIAITDHDIVPPSEIEVDGKNMDLLKYASDKGLCVIGGYEFSCDTNVDDVHIIGLGCDWQSSGILREMDNAVQSKVEGYRKLTEVLTKNSINVTWEDVLYNDGKPRKPQEVQRKHIFEAIAQKGYAGTWQEAKLLVRDNNEYNIKREKADPVKAVDIIHKAGGVAILAHPFLIDEYVRLQGCMLSREKYIDRLADAGLDGVEAAYAYNKTTYKGSLTCEEIEAYIRKRYGKALKIISGGSDYHNDAKKGVQNARMIGEKGITLEYFASNEYLNWLCAMTG